MIQEVDKCPDEKEECDCCQKGKKEREDSEPVEINQKSEETAGQKDHFELMEIDDNNKDESDPDPTEPTFKYNQNQGTREKDTRHGRKGTK